MYNIHICVIYTVICSTLEHICKAINTIFSWQKLVFLNMALYALMIYLNHTQKINNLLLVRNYNFMSPLQ